MGGPIFNAPVTGEDNAGTGFGIKGESQNVNGVGVTGVNNVGDNGAGVFGQGKSLGVRGHSLRGTGVEGISVGEGGTAQGVLGQSTKAAGVAGKSEDWVGVFGSSNKHDGVHGVSTKAAGVAGHGVEGPGVWGFSQHGPAGHFEGNVEVTGSVDIIGILRKGGGSFKIDHPLYPATKYLSHSFVESPDMKNVYDGVVVLDDKGESEINLPDWFGALNKDFRYQLTAIAAPGPNLYIAEEISETSKNYSNTGNKNNNSRFKVAGGTSGMKVSWQVTGIRKDPWANAHRIRVEEDKPDKERGYYTYPELYGQPEEKGISRLLVPEIRERAAHK